ncbi:MAG: DoxX family protein [Bacteroidetes bacterium]|nr:MAG: DoxX family protein [Bacteroidota bacterium]
MMEQFFSSQNNWAGLLLRVTIAVVLFPHGAQKLLGWFGGFGFDGTMQYFTQTVKLPYIIGLLVILIEFFAPIALVLGVGSKILAAVIAILFVGIMLTSHLNFGFFMNWMGNQAGEGLEYFLLAIGASLALMLNGSGKFAIDNMIVAALK